MSRTTETSSAGAGVRSGGGVVQMPGLHRDKLGGGWRETWRAGGHMSQENGCLAYGDRVQRSRGMNAPALADIFELLPLL
jgi:hypothetical protein